MHTRETVLVKGKRAGLSDAITKACLALLQVVLTWYRIGGRVITIIGNYWSPLYQSRYVYTDDAPRTSHTKYDGQRCVCRQAMWWVMEGGVT